jgi:hypothetical protein
MVGSGVGAGKALDYGPETIRSEAHAWDFAAGLASVAWARAVRCGAHCAHRYAHRPGIARTIGLGSRVFRGDVPQTEFTNACCPTTKFWL